MFAPREPFSVKAPLLSDGGHSEEEGRANGEPQEHTATRHKRRVPLEVGMHAKVTTEYYPEDPVLVKPLGIL